MARAELVFLNQREEDLIHQQSIETLEKIGGKVHSRSVLQLREEKGAKVD
jgi:trimethylamine:corrinoid methyltransferase-like protein